MKLSDYRVYPVTAIDGDGNGIYTISIDGIPGATTEARENKIGSIIFSVWPGTQTSAFSDLKIA